MNATNILKDKLSSITAFCGLLLAAVFVSGCASAPTNMSQLSPTLRADLSMPAPGKSKVIFVRPSHFAFLVHYSVHDGERLIGRSSSSSYFAYECDPGHHVFSTSMETLAWLDADLLPDRIYYVRVKATAGALIAEVKMFPLYPGCPAYNWQDLPKDLPGLDRERVTDEDVQHDTKGIKNYMERLKKYQDESRNGGKILPAYGQTTPLFSS